MRGRKLIKKQQHYKKRLPIIFSRNEYRKCKWNEEQLPVSVPGSQEDKRLMMASRFFLLRVRRKSRNSKMEWNVLFTIYKWKLSMDSVDDTVKYDCSRWRRNEGVNHTGRWGQGEIDTEKLLDREWFAVESFCTTESCFHIMESIYGGRPFMSALPWTKLRFHRNWFYCIPQKSYRNSFVHCIRNLVQNYLKDI